MKQDNLIFLILLVTMAMVMGSTFAIVSSLSTYKVHQTEAATNTASDSQTTTNKADKESNPTNASASVSDNLPGTEGSYSVLSPVETREVKRMLDELGHTSPTLAQSLKSFQQKNQLSTTGILDGLTLDTIINELSLTKARSFASGV